MCVCVCIYKFYKISWHYTSLSQFFPEKVMLFVCFPPNQCIWYVLIIFRLIKALGFLFLLYHLMFLFAHLNISKMKTEFYLKIGNNVLPLIFYIPKHLQSKPTLKHIFIPIWWSPRSFDRNWDKWIIKHPHLMGQVCTVVVTLFAAISLQWSWEWDVNLFHWHF